MVDLKNEPVFVAILGAFTPISALLVLYGVISTEQAAAWVAAATGVLVVAVVVAKTIRGQVTRVVPIVDDRGNTVTNDDGRALYAAPSPVVVAEPDGVPVSVAEDSEGITGEAATDGLS